MKVGKLIVVLAAVGGAAFAVSKVLKTEKGQKAVNKVKTKVSDAKDKIKAKKADKAAETSCDGSVCDDAVEEITVVETSFEECPAEAAEEPVSE